MSAASAPRPPPARPGPPPPLPPAAQEALVTAALPLERLHDDCRRGHLAGVHEAIGEKKELINQPGNLGFTPLHWAAQTGHKDICELLLHSGANVNAQNHTGDTPLHLAVWKSHEAVVALLLKEGGQWKADTTLRNQDGKLAEELARSDAVREIFDKLASSDSINVVQENDDSDDE